MMNANPKDTRITELLELAASEEIMLPYPPELIRFIAAMAGASEGIMLPYPPELIISQEDLGNVVDLHPSASSPSASSGDTLSKPKGTVSLSNGSKPKGADSWTLTPKCEALTRGAAMNITKLLEAESQVIDNMFRRNDIYAKVNPTASTFHDATSGFIRYALTLRSDQRFDAVERIQRELSAVLSTKRAKMNMTSPIQAIPISVPAFALEVPHPHPETLLWSPRKITTTPAHKMLLGRSYSGKESTDETINLADSNSCHTLIVGITGAGKSVLLQNMMLSLTANTSPSDLKIVLVDLKNEDMLPFRNLPHVITFAGTKDAAVKAIEYVVAEKEKRIANEGYKPFRLVLWIDEMAQLASMKGVAEMLGDLASIGRGKLINLVGATQYPTEKGGLGGLLKANFPVRLVGMVAPGQSHVATGRPKVHADLLPGKGAFLRCQGPTVTRFQSFNIEAHDVRAMADYITRSWNKGHEPPVIAPTIASGPPVGHAHKRDEIDTIVETIRELWQSGASKNSMAKEAGFKQYAGSYATKIDEAIRRLASTIASTQPSTIASTTLLLPSNHTSASEIDCSSSRSDPKIIKMKRKLG